MILLAEQAEGYIERQQREQAENKESISHEEYDTQKSRAEAFQ